MVREGDCSLQKPSISYRVLAFSVVYRICIPRLVQVMGERIAKWKSASEKDATGGSACHVPCSWLCTGPKKIASFFPHCLALSSLHPRPCTHLQNHTARPVSTLRTSPAILHPPSNTRSAYRALLDMSPLYCAHELPGWKPALFYDSLLPIPKVVEWHLLASAKLLAVSKVFLLLSTITLLEVVILSPSFLDCLAN